MVVDETTFKIIGAITILFLGFIISRIGSKIITRIHRKKYRKTLKRSPFSGLYSTIITTISLVITLFFLRVDLTEDFFLNVYELIPDVLSFVLLVSLVIMIVNGLMAILEKILEKSGVNKLIKEYDHGFLFYLMLAVTRVFLYAILGIFALSSLGVAERFSRTLGYIIYPIFIFFLAIIFFGVKDFVTNLFAGMYVKSSPQFQIGQRIRFRNLNGTIEEITNNYTLLASEKGYSVYIPNREFLTREIGLKEVSTDIPTLENLKKNYVAQTPSFCGPASAAMILNIFGYEFGQEELGKEANAKVGKGTRPRELIDAVKKLTKDDVLGVWIDIEKINDLRDEVMSWLENDALVMIDYKKNVLFPESKGAHYSVVLAVEGDEFVVLDPSSKKGGVFLADYKKIEKGMDTYSELIQGKRGYMVFAPKDSVAYNRLKQGLIYSDMTLYTRLNRRLQKEFEKLVPQTGFLEDMLPKNVKSFIEKHKNKEKISRIWRPKPRKD